MQSGRNSSLRDKLYENRTGVKRASFAAFLLPPGLPNDRPELLKSSNNILQWQIFINSIDMEEDDGAIADNYHEDQVQALKSSF